MTEKLDKYLQSLPEPDESKLVGLEARVWQRIEQSRSFFTDFLNLPLWLKSLPVISALTFGGVIGASAVPANNELDIFSSSPSYSVSKLIMPCCNE